MSGFCKTCFDSLSMQTQICNDNLLAYYLFIFHIIRHLKIVLQMKSYSSDEIVVLVASKGNGFDPSAKGLLEETSA